MADGPWREVGGCQEQWQPTHHSAALSALWFEGGGVAHCGHAHVQERGQVQPCALSPNTHTGRVAVKRVNQILKLPLSAAPQQKRRQKAFFSPGDFFAPNIYYSSTLLLTWSPPCRGNGKIVLDFSWFWKLDLFSVVKILLVPFTGCPANVTDSIAPPPATMHTFIHSPTSFIWDAKIREWYNKVTTLGGRM